MSRIISKVKALARPLFGTVTHASTDDGIAALTFDDGPHPEWTPRLLDVLERHDTRATFFMVGAHAERHPEIVERVAAEGHVIANHSWDHPSFAHIPRRERRRQVRACARALEPHGHRLFRPPGGHQTPMSVLDVRSLRFDVVGWSVDPRDYAERSATEIAEEVVREAGPGDIVLLHDALFGRPTDDRTPTIEAVDEILATTRDALRFVTVPELLRRGRRKRINWFWAPDEDPFR